MTGNADHDALAIEEEPIALIVTDRIFFSPWQLLRLCPSDITKSGETPILEAFFFFISVEGINCSDLSQLRIETHVLSKPRAQYDIRKESFEPRVFLKPINVSLTFSRNRLLSSYCLLSVHQTPLLLIHHHSYYFFSKGLKRL